MYIKRPKHNIMAFYIQEVTFFMLDGFWYCLLISLFVQKQRYAHFWIDWEWDASLIIEVGGNALAITLNEKHVLSLCKIYFFFATGWKKLKIKRLPISFYPSRTINIEYDKLSTYQTPISLFKVYLLYSWMRE